LSHPIKNLLYSNSYIVTLKLGVKYMYNGPQISDS
jgi:hypothetical protein